MDITNFGRPIHQTVEGKDFLFMNSSIPSDKEKGKKDFIGLKFFLLERNPFLFGLENNKCFELLIGPKKLRELFDIFLRNPNILNVPFILNFKENNQIVKIISIENILEKKLIFSEIEYLNKEWKS